MPIQDKINEHLTAENSFVKSIQVTAEGGDCHVPRGFSLRLLNCFIGKLEGKECAVHMIGGSVDSIDLEDSIVSVDGMRVKDVKTKNCRINFKEVPGALKADDVSSSEMSVDGKIEFENTESFWHEVDWKSSQEVNIVNSRVEFYDCKINLQAQLTIEGSEVYFIKADKCTFSKTVEIKDLGDETDSGSTNNIRGSAGVGPGSIVNFKKVKEISAEQGFDVKKSELNFFDSDKITSGQKPLATYDASAGMVEDCKKLESGEECLVLKTSGQLHVINCDCESKGKPAVRVEGKGSSCTLFGGEYSSKSDDCFLFKDGCFVEMYNQKSIKSDAKNGITAENNVSVLIAGCKDIKAKDNIFYIKNRSVLEANYCKTMLADYIFRGDDSSYMIKGDEEFKITSRNADVVGSGTFIVTQ